ncbi:MAG: DNA-binding protein, partial [Candidatus Aenigmatarchaeota archaeon]
MNEEEIKRKMLQQRMAHMSSEQMQQAQQQQQMEEVLKTVMSQVLDSKARERLSNLKLVKPEIAAQL